MRKILQKKKELLLRGPSTIIMDDADNLFAEHGRLAEDV